MHFNKLPLRLSSIFAVVLLIHLSSCHSGNNNSGLSKIFSSGFVDEDAFKTSIQGKLITLNTNDTLFSQLLLADTDGSINASYAYKLSGYVPLWIDASGLKPSATQMLRQLSELGDDGLDTAKYKIALLKKDIDLLQGKQAQPLDSLVAWDKAFTQTWLMAAADLLLGATDIKATDSLWFARNDTAFNGAALLAASVKDQKELPSLDTFRSTAQLYGQLKTALKQWQQLDKDAAYTTAKNNLEQGNADSTLQWLIQKELPNVTLAANDSFKVRQRWLQTYQYYHQLSTSGKMDSSTYASLKQMPQAYIAKIKLNMERLRALPRNIDGEHIWVTIPLMEVNYIKDDAVQFNSRVVVGKLSRQTPSLWANMSNIVFNPPWGVPPTILKNDIGPGVGRSGSAYLSRKGLRAFNKKGQDVTGSVNGSNYKNYSYRQPPGAGNSLGEVKFNLPNRWNIYLHDTPHRDNFSHSYRALSSGCVRVQYPKLLAELILDSDKYTSDKIDTIISTRKTKSQKLDRKLPVYIIYTTIAGDSLQNQLRYLKDVYGRDEKRY